MKAKPTRHSDKLIDIRVVRLAITFLALSLTSSAHLGAQTVTYALPGLSWPSGFAPQVPTSVSESYSFSGGGCLPSQQDFTQTFATAENVYPPFWYQRSYTPYGSAAYGGFSFSFPNVVPQGNPLIVNAGASEGQGTVTQMGTAAPYPPPIGSYGGQGAYTLTVSGHVVTEQYVLNVIDNDVGASEATDSRNYTISSTYDVESGVQTYTFLWTANGTEDAGTGCVAGYAINEAGTISVNWTTSSVVSPSCSLSITTSTLPNGTANSTYAPQSLVASGGTAPYTWSVTGLPTGLIATPQSDQSDLISGTPTQSGQSSVIVQVTDSVGCKATTTISLQINPAPLQITTSALPAVVEFTQYPNTQLMATGGTPPYTWSGSGVVGLVVDPSTGVLSGTPEVSGDLTETLTVTDSGHQSASVSLPILIAQAYFSQQTKEAAEQASLEWQIISRFFDGLAATPACEFDLECLAFAEAAARAADAGALVSDVIAKDPPDSNYAVVAPPFFVAVNPLPRGTNKDVAVAFYFLSENENMQEGYYVALETALNRSQGAALASDSKWQQTQLLAAKAYAYQLTNLQAVEPVLLYLCQSALQRSGARDIQIDPAQVNAAINNIASNGFPATTVQALESLGLTAEEISQIKVMPAPPFVTSAPSYPLILVSPSLLQPIRQSREALLPFIADRNNDLTVDCNDLKIVTSSLGARKGQSKYDPRADVNGDGVVDLFDAAFVAEQIGSKCSLIP